MRELDEVKELLRQKEEECERANARAEQEEGLRGAAVQQMTQQLQDAQKQVRAQSS